MSSGRLQRPWQGASATPTETPSIAYDPACYLCPGNARASGANNPAYTGVYVFDNDYPALTPHADSIEAPDSADLFAAQAESGVCRVVCFSPHHSHTLSHLSAPQIGQVVNVWAEQSAELGARFPDGAVQIFENKGELMGCSNPHPHGQIWAQATVPSALHRELHNCQAYLDHHGGNLLERYLAAELQRGERLVCDNAQFVALVPWWACWPFETLVLPRRPVARLTELDASERGGLADLLQRLSIRYDHLFNTSFPYSAGLHQAPANGRWDNAFTLHMHFYPPLLRSSEVRKFMVGYEMLAEPQRDLTPEAAAELLRAQPDRA